MMLSRRRAARKLIFAYGVASFSISCLLDASVFAQSNHEDAGQDKWDTNVVDFLSVLQSALLLANTVNWLRIRLVLQTFHQHFANLLIAKRDVLIALKGNACASTVGARPAVDAAGRVVKLVELVSADVKALSSATSTESFQQNADDIVKSIQQMQSTKDWYGEVASFCNKSIVDQKAIRGRICLSIMKMEKALILLDQVISRPKPTRGHPPRASLPAAQLDGESCD